MSFQLPKFLSNSFLQEVFVKNYGEGLIVNSFWGEWATKKGDNYASEMYRVHVSYKLNDIITETPVLLKVIKIK